MWEKQISGVFVCILHCLSLCKYTHICTRHIIPYHTIQIVHFTGPNLCSIPLGAPLLLPAPCETDISISLYHMLDHMIKNDKNTSYIFVLHKMSLSVNGKQEEPPLPSFCDITAGCVRRPCLWFQLKICFTSCRHLPNEETLRGSEFWLWVPISAVSSMILYVCFSPCAERFHISNHQAVGLPKFWFWVQLREPIQTLCANMGNNGNNRKKIDVD